MLQTPTIAFEWDALLDQLRRIGVLRGATRYTGDQQRGTIRLQCSAGRLGDVDRAVMACPVIEPRHRTEIENGYLIVIDFRRWWRMAVPFLLDPDNDRWHYRYEVIEADERPVDADED